MFPELFGGGNATLVITGEEILDSGVQVIAQPPGKKNQTIHLLSGGEKALTAIALVFAIFQLNPAPFCLLDEVDAPLDDANTERYAKLVTSMSRETQFLFISHNKIAMEMAQQLIGVTMQEQGVSRIVAVDMDAAVSWWRACDAMSTLQIGLAIVGGWPAARGDGRARGWSARKVARARPQPEEDAQPAGSDALRRASSPARMAEFDVAERPLPAAGESARPRRPDRRDCPVALESPCLG